MGGQQGEGRAAASFGQTLLLVQQDPFNCCCSRYMYRAGLDFYFLIFFFTRSLSSS